MEACMNFIPLHKKATRAWSIFILFCLLIVNPGPFQVIRVAAASGCSSIYSGGNNGWAIDLCTTDADVTTPMQVVLNGVSKGNAALVRIYHKSQNYAGTPQVAILYASGFIRLK